MNSINLQKHRSLSYTQIFLYEKEIKHIKCKANIANIIPHTLPVEKTKGSHRNKISYPDSAFSYLARQYTEPNIYSACYNLDYSGELNNLQKNWSL